jgi:hypothetical protein
MAEAWKPDHNHVKHAFVQNRGNVAASARNLNIARETLFRYISKNKDLQEALDESREIQSQDELELAISLNYLFMQNYKENPSLASKHVIFTLERKGHTRGYLRDTSDISLNKDLEMKFDGSMAQVLSLLSPERNIDDSNINSETKS